ncbi:hypothetical protein [Erwinia oleae]|uniref:hypothetical protein n=1 Tax=Erwinia oleae TaxID=796334 RepID=UPI00054CF087|nr:hypothetical protein [Erwinia oleae]
MSGWGTDARRKWLIVRPNSGDPGEDVNHNGDKNLWARLQADDDKNIVSLRAENNRGEKNFDREIAVNGLPDALDFS